MQANTPDLKHQMSHSGQYVQYRVPGVDQQDSQRDFAFAGSTCPQTNTPQNPLDAN
jgi:hypothetical protein